MRLALDTNVMVYAEGVERAPQDAAKCLLARQTVARVGAERFILARQALAELHAVLVRRDRAPPVDAARRVRLWEDRSETIDTNATVFASALEIASEHRIPIFDAITLAAAVEGRCDFLLSEDFQAGFAWRGVVVANPFAATPHPRLARLLA